MSAHIRTLPRTGWHGARDGTMRAAFAAAWRALRTRQSLAELDDRMLRDIGLTPSEALREVERAPWDLKQRAGR